MIDMDGKMICNKLVGTEDERAVSPVIGVILMVAITVILAAVIAAFVLDIGDDMGEGSVNAAVSTDVSQSDSDITFTLTDAGGAESFVVRGDIINSTAGSGAGENDATADGEAPLSFDGTGTTDTLDYADKSDEDLVNNEVLAEEGSVNIVAIDGNSESVIGSVDWDFSDD